MGELILTTFDWVPERVRGLVRDLRARWALEEAGLPYRVFKFYSLYLLPFNDSQISKYLKQRFPVWSWLPFSGLRQARRIVENVPELSVRPMLLELIPDLARSKRKVTELFGLYEFMVESWLERERDFASKDKLLEISKTLAVYLYASYSSGGGDRASVEDLNIALGDLACDVEWNKLRARSLLNRDGDGLLKFAHRSILEYLFVCAAIDGDVRCFEVRWSELMRSLFVSWGWGHSLSADVSRAKEILSMDLRKSELSPLSSHLPLPRQLSSGELRRLRRAGSAGLGSKRVNPRWRKISLRIKAHADTWQIYDFEYDLVWKFARLQEVEDRSVYRIPLASVSSMLTGDYKLPSLEQFISLVDAQIALGEEGLIVRGESYWIGDQLGRVRHIVSAISDNIMSDDRLTHLDLAESLGGPDTPVRFYEVSIKRKAQDIRKPFEAVAVLVKAGGAADAWFAASQEG